MRDWTKYLIKKNRFISQNDFNHNTAFYEYFHEDINPLYGLCCYVNVVLKISYKKNQRVDFFLNWFE